MAKIGDRVNVTLSGTTLSGGTSGNVTISPQASVVVTGTIVEDHGTQWLVELTISVGGKNRILVPKWSQR